MIPRLLQLPQEQSFFLFGARGVGKSTLLSQLFDPSFCLWLDLLDPSLEDLFALNPSELKAMVLALPPDKTHIIIDEVQKVPRLLDVVHSLIETTDKYFILTGSSARKLKADGVNLLAGRAFVYHLFPFSFLEIEKQFNLKNALQMGLLPRTLALHDEDVKTFLRAYTATYLKEEIWHEHFIKRLNPFRRFLEVAAQCNGKIINYTNIARDVGIDDKTVKEYFLLLEDTLVGFFLEPFRHSFRKRLSHRPKFYFFDLGVTHSLAHLLSLPLRSGTSAYGEAFEHFIVLECLKLGSYFKPEYRFSYLQTKDGLEVDLVVERPGEQLLFIEIKSAPNVKVENLSQFMQITKDFEKCEAICLSNDKHAKCFDHVTVLPWALGLKKIFSGTDHD